MDLGMASVTTGATDDGAGWSWAACAPPEDDVRRYATEEWAPPSSVRRPWVRVGRWTLLYRRAA